MPIMSRHGMGLQRPYYLAGKDACKYVTQGPDHANLLTFKTVDFGTSISKLLKII